MCVRYNIGEPRLHSSTELPVESRPGSLTPPPHFILKSSCMSSMSSAKQLFSTSYWTSHLAYHGGFSMSSPAPAMAVPLDYPIPQSDLYQTSRHGCNCSVNQAVSQVQSRQ